MMAKSWRIRTNHGREFMVQADAEAAAVVVLIANHELQLGEVPSEVRIETGFRPEFHFRRPADPGEC
jgi:hypothetical protein